MKNSLKHNKYIIYIMKNSKVRIYIYQKLLIAISSLCIWFYEIKNKYKIFQSVLLQSKKNSWNYKEEQNWKLEKQKKRKQKLENKLTIGK